MSIEKGRPANGVAQAWNGCGKHTTMRPKAAMPKLMELACLHLLDRGDAGATRITASRCYGDFDFRNQVDNLRNDRGLLIASTTIEHVGQSGKTSRISRYWLLTREEARRAVLLVNEKRKERGAPPLSAEQVSCYLARYPNAVKNPTTEA